MQRCAAHCFKNRSRFFSTQALEDMLPLSQECWSPDSDVGLFLKTPLLDELHSLKLLLVGAVDASRLDHGLASPRQVPR